MTTVFLFRMVELKAGPRSKLRQEHPSAGGAYVDCAVPAQSLAGAEAIFRKVLADDDYSLVRFDEVVELGGETGWSFPDIPGEYREMAARALDSGDAGLRPIQMLVAATAAPHSVQRSPPQVPAPRG